MRRGELLAAGAGVTPAVEAGGGTPARFGHIIRSDLARWRAAIALAGTRPQ